MRPVLLRIVPTALLGLIIVCGASLAMAQDEAPPATEEALAAAADEAEAAVEVEEKERRHPGFLAVALGAEHMVPINILKEEIYDMNDLTGASMAFGGGLRIYVLDMLAVHLNVRRGGTSFVDDKPEEMALIDEKLDGVGLFTPDSYLKLDGGSVGVVTYLGDAMMPESRFNPFVSANVLYYDWAVTTNGRDSAVLTYQDEPIEGADFGVGIGFGTEYGLNDSMLLELGLVWNYLLTGDEIVFDGFQAPNDSFYWTNTHWWGLSANLVFGF